MTNYKKLYQQVCPCGTHSKPSMIMAHAVINNSHDGTTLKKCPNCGRDKSKIKMIYGWNNYITDKQINYLKGKYKINHCELDDLLRTSVSYIIESRRC